MCEEHPELQAQYQSALPRASNTAASVVRETDAEFEGRLSRMVAAAVKEVMGGSHGHVATVKSTHTFPDRNRNIPAQNTKSLCNECGQYHGPVCWYAQPNLAPQWWAPHANTADNVLSIYRNACQRLGLQPKKPGSGQPPPVRGAAGGASASRLPQPSFYTHTAQFVSNANTTRQLRSFTQRSTEPTVADGGVTMSFTIPLATHSLLARKILELDELRPMLNQSGAVNLSDSPVIQAEVSSDSDVPAEPEDPILLAPPTGPDLNPAAYPRTAADGSDVRMGVRPLKGYDARDPRCLSVGQVHRASQEDRDRLRKHNSVKGGIPFFVNNLLEEGVSVQTPDGRHHLLQRMMLDTGSDVAIMEEVVAKAIGLSYSPVDASLRGVGGVLIRSSA